MIISNIKVAYDSRNVTEGMYFVPIVGNRVDGHDFIPIAIQNGAAGIIEENELYDYTKRKLKAINPTIIAITGSVGKSTMAHYLDELLSLQYKVIRNKHNRKIGIATDIMNILDEDTEIFICEASVGQDIGVLSDIGQLLEPHITILLNVTENNNHLMHFKDLEDVVKNKINLLNCTRDNGYIYVSSDDRVINKYVHKYLNKSENLSFFPNSNYKDIKSQIDTEVLNRSLQLAYQIAKEQFNISKEALDAKVKNISPLQGRLNVLDGINNFIIIDDTYNISDSSIYNAIEYIDNNFIKDEKYIVLGGIDGYSAESSTIYKDIADKLSLFNKIFLVGKLANNYTHYLSSDKYLYFDTAVEVAEYIKNNLYLNSEVLVLFKGGEDARLEKSIELLVSDSSNLGTNLIRQEPNWK